MVDPDAPDGFLRPEFIARETARRRAEVSAAINRLVYAVEDRYGSEAGRIARAHFAPLLDVI